MAKKKDEAKPPPPMLGMQYMIAVLALSWAVQTLIFSGIAPPEYTAAYMYVPALLAIIFYLLQKEPIEAQVRRFFAGLDIRSLAFAIVAPLAIIALIMALALASGLGTFNPDVLAEKLQLPSLLAYAGMLIAIMPSMFGEEYGWRGYLLPTLTPSLGKVKATLAVGAVWGLWHIPSYYLAYSVAGLGDPLILTGMGVLFTVLIAFPYSYCYYLGRGIIPCIILHAIWDVTMVSVAFTSPAVPGFTEEVPGIVGMPWAYVLACMIGGGMIAAAFFAWEFGRMERKRAGPAP